MKEIVLTKDNVQQVADELDKYDIVLSVVKEDDNLGKKLGPGLFDWGFGEPASSFYPADGTITFKFDEDTKEVSYERVSKND